MISSFKGSYFTYTFSTGFGAAFCSLLFRVTTLFSLGYYFSKTMQGGSNG
jgi:hypothetical protein